MTYLTTIDDINNVVSSNPNIILIIRIGDISDPLTVSFDEILLRIKNKISKFVKIYFLTEVLEGLEIPPSCLLIFYNCKLLEFNFENEIQNNICGRQLILRSAMTPSRMLICNRSETDRFRS